MKKILVMAMASILIVACGNKEKKNAAIVDEVPQVKIATVNSSSIPQTETYSGTVDSDVKNNISPNMAYRIEKIFVEVGDKVRRGQCVVQLDASSLNQLKIQIENQTVEFNRTKALYEIGGASKAEYDNAEMQLNVMRTQYRQLSQNTQLFSPISGVVTARNYDNGDMYGGTPILTIEQTNPVKLKVNVSEEYYKLTKVGQTADITVDAYEGESFTGKITIVYPSIDPATHTFPIEITISNSAQKVRPGMFARATINFGNQQHVVIPDEALVKQIGAGDRYVYVYNPETKTVAYNKVELGKHLGKNYEILSGIEPGNQVVIAGQSRLNNGKKVEVVK